MLKRIVAAAILSVDGRVPVAGGGVPTIAPSSSNGTSCCSRRFRARLGLQTPRYFAMLHVAMFDAVNSIERALRAVPREGRRLARRFERSGGGAGGA